MPLLDFITGRDDRHLSNIAIRISVDGEQFSPLNGNGRSLFYEDTPETVENAIRDVLDDATDFGMSGTYWDHITDIAAEEGPVIRRMNATLKSFCLRS